MNDQSMEILRKAIGDRAAWLALMYEAFCEILPAAETERLVRKAIRAYGQYKGLMAPHPYPTLKLVWSFIESGSADTFDAEIAWTSAEFQYRVRCCPLVNAWRNMGLPPDRIALLCDIAMEGDRSRAAALGVDMNLRETIAKGDAYCRIGLRPQ